MSFNSSDNVNRKQHRIFDLIETGNSEEEEEEVMESGYDKEVELLQSNGPVVSHEDNTVKLSTEENEQGTKLSKQMKNNEETEKDFNHSHRNNFLSAKKDFISVIEDVGGKCFM
jgi:hypothetical protein